MGRPAKTQCAAGRHLPRRMEGLAVEPWSICLTPFQDALGWSVHVWVEPVDGGCRICYLAKSQDKAEEAARAIREHFIAHKYPTKAGDMAAATHLIQPALVFPFRTEET